MVSRIASFVREKIAIRSRHSVEAVLPIQEWNIGEVKGISSRLVHKLSFFAGVFFIATSVIPANVGASQFTSDFYVGDTDASAEMLVFNDDGYLTKINPQTDESDRTVMTDRLIHAVQPGESLSVIAQQYGLKMQTLRWENNLTSDRLRVGQKLIIPPVDGVTHYVAKGETLDKVATKYSVDKAFIVKQNGLQSEVLTKGQAIYVPNGKLFVAEISRSGVSRIGTVSRVSEVPLSSTSAAPSEGKILIFPTRGKLTQGFRRGHYAYDIADPSKPPIWAAATGKVVQTSSGTWGGGYGNHVVIDHGNGIQTLYAHLDYLTVKEGDIVDQGQVIGRMGRTGRVYGRTGIHLHFEVIKNGVKQVPSKYY